MAKGRFGKQDFRYVADEDVYICPAGETLPYRYTNEEDGLILRRYWTNACQSCPIKKTCTSGKERRITRWEHEHVLEAVQRRLDEHPEKMRQRRETVEHPFGTIKARMGATHFLMKTLPQGRLRDGAARAGLQHDQGDEHHGCPAADGSDEGIASPKTPASSKAPTTRSPNVFTRPRPKSDMNSIGPHRQRLCNLPCTLDKSLGRRTEGATLHGDDYNGPWPGLQINW